MRRPYHESGCKTEQKVVFKRLTGCRSHAEAGRVGRIFIKGVYSAIDMIEILGYLKGPIIGGIIGYITNDIAIRMLFRPHTVKYIFGWHVPFTPGIIPKEKGRIAAAIGGAISENLMNKEVLEAYLLSDEMLHKIESSIDSFFQAQQTNDETLREFLCHYLSEEDVESIVTSTTEELTSQIHQRLAKSALGKQIAHVAVQHVMQKMQHFGSSFGDALKEDGIGSGGGIGDMIGRGIGRLFGKQAQTSTADFISALAEPVEEMLAKNINEMLENNSHQIVSDLLTTETSNLLSTPVSSLLAGKDNQLQQAKSSILSLYRMVISEQLPRILEAIDISRIVEGRINEMNMDETERLIFQVMDKELKAIVWLGALLGCVMGIVNAII